MYPNITDWTSHVQVNTVNQLVETAGKGSNVYGPNGSVEFDVAIKHL